jgi:hypothetical protein
MQRLGFASSAALLLFHARAAGRGSICGLFDCVWCCRTAGSTAGHLALSLSAFQLSGHSSASFPGTWALLCCQYCSTPVPLPVLPVLLYTASTPVLPVLLFCWYCSTQQSVCQVPGQYIISITAKHVDNSTPSTQLVCFAHLP